MFHLGANAVHWGANSNFYHYNIYGSSEDVNYNVGKQIDVTNVVFDKTE